MRRSPLVSTLCAGALIAGALAGSGATASERDDDAPPHWAFVAPTMPPLPALTDDSWVRQPLDRFVLARLESEGLRPSPPADRRTIARRLHLDLTGLPPTPDELRAFLDDDAPDAEARLVDRLLGSPRHGEHMARYWLDLVRFADTNGIHHDHYREMSPYRDWVIRAFNDGVPFDRFVTDQIAGDLRENPSRDALIASGFNRLHLIIDRGTALPEESLSRNVIDRVTAFGTAFLGLTVQCAVCHDHKHDPFTQRDFYRLSAFFNNFDGDPETGSGELDKQRGLQPPYLELPSAAQAATLAELDAKIDGLRAEVERRKAEAAQAADGAASGGPAEDAGAPPWKAAEEELNERRAERDRLRLDVPAAMVMKERAERRTAHVLIRGAYDHPGEPVERGTPTFLPPLNAAGDVPNRMDLARWLVSPDHPLFARVAVNRFWQQLFGVGLVETSEDLGTQGDRPEYPELLDHLAVSFQRSGWDVKALLRSIVLSSTYRQSSRATPGQFRQDPKNRRLARGSRYRMDAETIRDLVLFTSGSLNPEMYGKSVKPPQPEGVWEAVTLPSSFPRSYAPDTGDATRRRSVYTFWKRGMPPPQMSILNAPTRESCTARRERTNTPLQALLMLNEPEYLAAAGRLAAKVLRDEATDEARLRELYEIITSRVPDAAESAALLAGLREIEAAYREDGSLARELCASIVPAEGAGDSDDPTRLAAWTMVTSAIYNLDLTKTRS